MTIATSFYTLALQPTFSGDAATSRQSAIQADGTRVVVDLIQSLPKKGRWRHVVRGQYTAPRDAVSGVFPSATVTITVDHPEDMLPQKIMEIVQGFTHMFDERWDEVAAGQQ